MLQAYKMLENFKDELILKKFFFTTYHIYYDL